MKNPAKHVATKKSSFKACLLLAFVVVASVFSTPNANGQTTNAYALIKGYLVGQGYKICEEKYSNLAQGEEGYVYRTFYPNWTYKIYAFSDDDDVTDVDLYLYYSDGVTIFSKDADPSSVAAINLSPAMQRYLKVGFRNYASATPRYESTIYLLIGFK